MTKLILELTIPMLGEYDEALLNKKFSPFSFYQIVQTANTGITEEIPNQHQKNKLYKQMYEYLDKGDLKKAREIQYKLKAEIDKDRGLINTFIETQTEIEEEESANIEFNVWTPRALGVESYIDE